MRRRAPRVQCELCGRELTASRLSAHQKGKACREDRKVRQMLLNRDLMARQGFSVISRETRTLLSAAGVSIVWSETLYVGGSFRRERESARSLRRQPWADAWLAEAADKLSSYGLPDDEITRLLRLGKGSGELTRALSLAALADVG